MKTYNNLTSNQTLIYDKADIEFEDRKTEEVLKPKKRPYHLLLFMLLIFGCLFFYASIGTIWAYVFESVSDSYVEDTTSVVDNSRSDYQAILDYKKQISQPKQHQNADTSESIVKENNSVDDAVIHSESVKDPTLDDFISKYNIRIDDNPIPLVIDTYSSDYILGYEQSPEFSNIFSSFQKYTDGSSHYGKSEDGNYDIMINSMNFDEISRLTFTHNSYENGYYENMAHRVFELINQQRANYGSSSLIWSDELYDTCIVRSNDLSILFSHDRPDGTNGCDFTSSYLYDVLGKSYAVAENIAESSVTLEWSAKNADGKDIDFSLNVCESSICENAVKSWMNSTIGHKEAIVNPNVTFGAVGCYYSSVKNKFYFCYISI